MAPKPSKGKAMASSSKGTKRSRTGKEAQAHKEDAATTTTKIWTFLDHGARREFLDNWESEEISNQVKIRGHVIKFTPAALNKFLGTPNMDPQSMRDLLLRPPYRDIYHILNSPRFMDR
ncbi:hypothetical protein HAX54_005139 [Datura stramonium]|uniref:Uncharacterized protein n=1 Tax=Datura stramonium TaxID=4076 RepID=A0ABS8RU00_DATST|nr:hypothetical protein [Datura stramonium]